MTDAVEDDIRADEYVPPWASEEDAWWAGRRFTGGIKALRDDRNRTYDEICRLCDQALAYFVEDLDEPTVHSVREDVMEASAWSARREAIAFTASRVYQHGLNGLFIAPLIAVVLLSSTAPVWLRVVSLAAAAWLVAVRFVLDVVFPYTISRWIDVILVGSLAVAGMAAIAALVIPFRGVTATLWIIGAVVGATALYVIIVRLIHRMINRFTRLRALALLALILGSGAYAADTLLVDTTWRREIVVALAVGLTTSALNGIWLIAIELGNRGLLRLHEYRKVRAIPEAEFVQSTLWLLFSLRAFRHRTGRTYAPTVPYYFPLLQSRGDIAYGFDYLASILRPHVANVLSRMDSRDTAWVRKEFATKANTILLHKRNVMLGPQKLPDAISYLQEAAGAAAERQWDALEGTASDVFAMPSPSRITVARKSLALLLPLTVAAIAWKLGSREVLIPAALVTAYAAVDLVAPGTSSRVQDASTNAKDSLGNLFYRSTPGS
jgi:hypothetical protein